MEITLSEAGQACLCGWPHARCSSNRGAEVFLYLLLLHVAGAKCWRDIRTVDGVIHDSFQAAAVAVGLCSSDEHYHAALQDAISIPTPARARFLLATIPASCDVADRTQFWILFSADLGLSEHMAVDAALFDVQQHLARHGQLCSAFGLPMPQHFDHQDICLHPAWTDVLDSHTVRC